uniref:hypothetical protein n=1 Tax=Burkholderia gladioli TaxID=28095 RepID=UPI003C7A589D
IQQTDLVADDVLVETTHGVTPWRLRAVLMKIRTSIKTGNPTSWQGLVVRSSLNFYRIADPGPAHEFSGLPSWTIRVTGCLGQTCFEATQASCRILQMKIAC